MFMQHQPQRDANKDRREDPSATEAARCRHHQRSQLYERKQQIIGHAKHLTEGQLLHLIQTFKQRYLTADGP